MIAIDNIRRATRIGRRDTVPVVHTGALLDWHSRGPIPEAVSRLDGRTAATKDG